MPTAHILVVDDDFEDRFILSQTFSELGCNSTVDYAEDGLSIETRLAAIEEGGVKLIILDLNMPIQNGTETLRIIKNNVHYSQIPVIIFSTSVNEIEKAICMELGAQEYVTKPSRYDDYVDTCRKFCAIAQA